MFPTGNTDINDSIQFSDGGGIFNDSRGVLNPVLSQPGVGSDEGSGLAVVNVDPVTGLATGYSFTGTQDSTLPNNGTYAYITPCPSECRAAASVAGNRGSSPTRLPSAMMAIPYCFARR